MHEINDGCMRSMICSGVLVAGSPKRSMICIAIARVAHTLVRTGSIGPFKGFESGPLLPPSFDKQVFPKDSCATWYAKVGTTIMPSASNTEGCCMFTRDWTKFIISQNELEGYSTSLQLPSTPAVFAVAENQFTGSLPHQPAELHWHAYTNSFAGAISESFLRSVRGVKYSFSVHHNELAGA
eukprot:2619760-Amphidinium_carterae.1